MLQELRFAVRSLAQSRGFTAAAVLTLAIGIAATTIVCYTMYTVAPETEAKFGEDNLLVYTVPFVVFGLGRYLLLVETQRGGGSPTRVLLGGDAAFVANALAWAAVVAVAVWG